MCADYRAGGTIPEEEGPGAKVLPHARIEASVYKNTTLSGAKKEEEQSLKGTLVQCNNSLSAGLLSLTRRKGAPCLAVKEGKEP